MRDSIDELLKGRYGELFVRAIQILLGLLFIYASLDKIWNPALFAKAISNYRIVPLPLLHISAIILPWLEMIIGLALIVNRYERAAYTIVGGLLLIFVMAILSAMARGLDFNCGCFKMDAEASNLGFRKVIQNLGLFLSVLLIEYRNRLVGLYSR